MKYVNYYTVAALSLFIFACATPRPIPLVLSKSDLEGPKNPNGKETKSASASAPMQPPTKVFDVYSFIENADASATSSYAASFIDSECRSLSAVSAAFVYVIDGTMKPDTQWPSAAYPGQYDYWLVTSDTAQRLQELDAKYLSNQSMYKAFLDAIPCLGFFQTDSYRYYDYQRNSGVRTFSSGEISALTNVIKLLSKNGSEKAFDMLYFMAASSANYDVVQLTSSLWAHENGSLSSIYDSSLEYAQQIYEGGSFCEEHWCQYLDAQITLLQNFSSSQ